MKLGGPETKSAPYDKKLVLLEEFFTPYWPNFAPFKSNLAPYWGGPGPPWPFSSFHLCPTFMSARNLEPAIFFGVP